MIMVICDTGGTTALYDNGGTAGNGLIVVDDSFKVTEDHTGLLSNYPVPELTEADLIIDKKELEKIENIAYERSMHADKIDALQALEINDARQSIMKHKKPHMNRRIIN
jgi:hypothetical protein